MSVRVYGINKLDENYYDSIFIKQSYRDKNKFRVDVSGKESEDSMVRISSRLSSKIKGQDDVDKISMIVDSYLCNTIISELTFPDSRRNYSGVYGDRILKLSISNPKLFCIYQAITDKYLQDRWNFCSNNEDINNIKISVDENASYYERGKGYGKSPEFIKFGLKCDAEGNTEKDFIIEYLYDRFSKIGKEIIVFPIYDGNLYCQSEHIISYVFECGDLRVYIPNDKRIMFLCDMVDEYNIELSERDNSVKKRQLKLEGF